MKIKLSILFLSLIVLCAFTFNGDSPRDLSKKPTTFGNGTLVVKGPALDGPLSTLNESFEGGTFPPAGWIKLNPDAGTGWASITAGTTPLPGWNGGVATVPTGGGTKTAYASWNTGGPTANNQWLVTPQITNVQAGDSLKIWLRKPGFTNGYLDHFDIKISTTTPTVAAMTINVVSLTHPANSPDTNWMELKFRLGNFVTTGANIYIGFREWVLDNLNDGAAYQLDLISVTSPPILSTWSEQTSGLTTELNSVSAVNDDICWASGAAGKVVRTINKGVQWTNVSGDLPTTNPAYVIWGFDANNAVLTTSPSAGAGTRIFKTTNGGTNWVQKLFQADGWGDGFHFLNANTGFFYGDHTGTGGSARLTIFKTIDGGNTWDSTGMFFGTTADGWNNAMFGFGNQMWLGTNSTTIAYSSNAGANWVAQTTSLANHYAIWFNNATTGMAGGPATATWKTTNSGTNWTVTPDSIANNCTGLCGSGTSWWQTTFLPNVYYSPNDGATWSTQYIAPAGNFRHITKARTGETIWGVRTNGGISRYGTLTGVTPINTPVPSDYALMQNYPNPFNPATKINFALPKAGLVTLKIYNIIGQEVATLVNEVKSAGTYSVDFNASELSSGVYFYSIKSGDFADVKKMTLIK